VITIHHLGMSQSDRVVWLMEELGLPYTLKWYDRGPDFLAPSEYRKLHGAGTAPIIEDDGGVVLCESGAIVEYIIQRHGKGRLGVAPSEPNYPDYLFWMTFSNSLQSTFFMRALLNLIPEEKREGNPMVTVATRREASYYKLLNDRLGQVDYLAGPEFTGADVMMTFNVTSLAQFGGRTIADLPNVQAYAERITARPAYVKAMGIAGPGAKRPA
jgi:glutathione S-transferase